MLVPNQYVEVKWRKSNRKWYEDKGYIFTKVGDVFTVRAEDLVESSKIKVKIQCDYCGDIIERPYRNYVSGIENIGKIACGKPECKGKKISESKVSNIYTLEYRTELLDKFYSKCEELGFAPLTTIDEFFTRFSDVTFMCPVHGKMTYQYIVFMRSDYGCKECGMDAKRETLRLSTNDVIEIVESKGCKILNPEEYTKAINKNLLIECRKCGKVFLASLETIIYGSGQCQECANKDTGEKLKKSDDEVKYLIESQNGNKWVNPGSYVGMFTPSLLIQCGCGNTYQTSLKNYIQKIDGKCTMCSPASSGEYLIKQFLDSHNIKYTTQESFNGDCRDINPLPFDFYLPDYNLCIEFDGKQHFEPIWGEKSFKKTLLHDGMKNNYCRWNNIDLLRIPYFDGNNIEEIISEYLHIDKTEPFRKIEYIPTVERRANTAKEEIA